MDLHAGTDIDPDCENPLKSGSPDRNLIAAILRQATRDYFSEYEAIEGRVSSGTKQSEHSRKHRELARMRDESTAHNWMFGQRYTRKPEPFTFQWCCQMVGMCPDAFRDAIVARKGRRLN